MVSNSAEKRLHELKNRFDIIEREITLQRTVLKIVAIRSASSLITNETDPDRLPFWAEIWPSSVALAAYLLNQNWLEGKSCLELGCGVGLAGLGARLIGADVVQTDCFPEALEFAKINAERNGIEGIKYFAADWRAFPLRSKFDLVIGADVLYERTNHDAFLEALRISMHSKSIAIVADPFRIPAWHLLTRLESEGWEINLFDDTVEWDERNVDIIFCLMRAP